MQFHPHTYSGLFLPLLVAYTATATEGGTDKPIISILPARVVSMIVVLMVTVNNSPDYLYRLQCWMRIDELTH